MKGKGIMGGHVLWLDSEYIKVIDDFVKKSNERNELTVDVIKESMKPVVNQAKFVEQLKIIRKMKDCGIEDERICKMFGYDRFFLDELLSLDEASEYDYSQFKRLNL